MHAVLPSSFWNVPAAQTAQCTLDAWFWYCPLPHWPQFDLPVDAWLYPTGQALHDVVWCEVESMNCPVEQLPQTVLAATEHALVRFVPAPQLLHVLQLALLPSFW